MNWDYTVKAKNLKDAAGYCCKIEMCFWRKMFKVTTPHVWPVIHLKEGAVDLALDNAAIAHRCGCAGVFVIDMEGDNQQVVPTAKRIRQAHPTLKVGVNLLGVNPLMVLSQSLAAGLDATWTDSPGVTSRNVSSMAQAIADLLKDHPDHQFFGSVAFKYQPAESDPSAAAHAAARLGMVPTTSGAATGAAPAESKLAAMREALGGRPLAVASGITPENVEVLGPYLTHILVATGVSDTFHELSAPKLQALMHRLPNCRF